MTNQGKKYKNIKAFKDFQLNLQRICRQKSRQQPVSLLQKLLEGWCFRECVCRCKDAVTPPNQTADGFPVDSTVQVNRRWWADTIKHGRLLQQQQQQKKTFTLCSFVYLHVAAETITLQSAGVATAERRESILHLASSKLLLALS